ncbi:hypothetical protein HJA90_14655 [Rhizobium bangladeshense]|uniref:hypothetical protein n=1 Tax=Rhizobium bangladeshense TaxID=1138189 RepID=UPI001C831FC3|nr:hypothetical protein [Rhizobium bangladeshense]MBX4884816.1 hypothetical protein [Rhizobium bangladeshense]
MATLDTLLTDLIAEVTRIQAPDALSSKDGDSFSMPGLIATGDGRSIATSREMERLIEAVAQELKGSDPSISQRYTDKEWNWLVRGTFGPALMIIDLDDDPAHNAQRVLASIRSQIDAAVTAQARENAFGCTLFGTFNVAPFAIGPVSFEPRSDWLTRKQHDGEITNTTARRVRQSWRGAKLRRRKAGYDAIREKDILDAVGKCPYVCTVRTKGLAPEASRLKAQTASHLAMAAVALRWSRPSEALAGFRLLTDPGIRRQRSLVFVPGVRILAGAQLVGMPHGPSISAEDWLAELEENRDGFALIGQAIDYFLNVSGVTARPKIMNAIVQALLWFYEACREEVDLMAVVKFTATLDALAAGGKSGGIRRLVNARLGIQDDKPIRKDGPTLKAAVDEIYSDGRSRTIHGTNDKLGKDWSSTRRLAEQFARLCLITSVGWAAENPSIDNPAALQKN